MCRFYCNSVQKLTMLTTVGAVLACMADRPDQIIKYRLSDRTPDLNPARTSRTLIAVGADGKSHLLNGPNRPATNSISRRISISSFIRSYCATIDWCSALATTNIGPGECETHSNRSSTVVEMPHSSVVTRASGKSGQRSRVSHCKRGKLRSTRIRFTNLQIQVA